MEEDRTDATGDREVEKAEEAARSVVVFTMGGDSFALPLEDVAEIIRMVEITPLPTAPDFLLGIINVHGNLASVVSLARVLGTEDTQEGELLILLVPEKGGYALLVGPTSGFTRYTSLEEVAGETTVNGNKVAFVEGLFRDAGKLVSLINPDKLQIWIDGEFAKGDN